MGTPREVSDAHIESLYQSKLHILLPLCNMKQSPRKGVFTEVLLHWPLLEKNAEYSKEGLCSGPLRPEFKIPALPFT